MFIPVDFRETSGRGMLGNLFIQVFIPVVIRDASNRRMLGN